MDKIMRLHLEGNLSGEGFKLEYRPLEEQAKQIAEQLPSIQAEVDFLAIQHLSRDEVLSEARDIYSRWPTLERDEKRQIIENTVEKIIVVKDEATIELAYIPNSSELMANGQRNLIDSATSSNRAFAFASTVSTIASHLQ